MAAAGDAQLFTNEFLVEKVDDQKYDRVARLTATSYPDASTKMILDVNTDLFPCAAHDRITITLASSLKLDGTKEDKGWRDVTRGEEATLADMFDYVCHGKLYKFDGEDDGEMIKAYVSFGGLLLALEGPYKTLTPLRVDYIYLLAKR